MWYDDIEPRNPTDPGVRRGRSVGGAAQLPSTGEREGVPGHTVLAGDIEERNFEDWSMGFINMDKTGDLPKYKDYIEENLELRSFQADSQDAYEFMTMFNKINE